MSYITDFFKFIKFEEKDFITKLTWDVFDYIPYVYFICLFKGYSIINIKEHGLRREWSLESMPIETYQKVISIINYHPMWLIHDVYNENKNLLEDNVILTYHRNNGCAVYVNDN
jgi:hypothetical protein